VASIQIYDNGDCDGSLGGGNGNDENSKKQTVHPVWPQVFVKGDEVQVYAIENEFDAHKHRNQVAAGKETVNANEEQRRADKQ
jgi:hypothetical protein